MDASEGGSGIFFNVESFGSGYGSDGDRTEGFSATEAREADVFAGE